MLIVGPLEALSLFTNLIQRSFVFAKLHFLSHFRRILCHWVGQHLSVRRPVLIRRHPKQAVLRLITILRLCAFAENNYSNYSSKASLENSC